MTHRFSIECSCCGRIAERAFATTCESCGGLFEVRYQMGRVRLRDSDDPHEGYFDLLPVRDPGLLVSGRFTPLVRAKTLGERLGLSRLFLKDETANRTGTTKDRMAAVALPFLRENGVTHFCTSSTGNSSTAYAQAIGSIPDMRMELFTAEDFRDRVHYVPSSQITHHVLRDASFVEAADQSARFAAAAGLVAEGGFFNPGRREGLKVPWLEAVEQAGEPLDWYVQAVSSAMGVHGVYKAAREAVEVGLANRMPRLLCAQQATCSPMVHAWEDGSETIQPHHVVQRPAGIAEAILLGNPTKAYPFVRRIVLASGGEMVAVTEPEIVEAQSVILEDEGISVCPAAATAVAALAKLARLRKGLADARILVNLTGSHRQGIPQAPVDRWWVRSDSGWLVAT